MDIIEKIGLVALGAIISTIVYLIKRKIENKPQMESLEKHKKVLDIHKQMNDQGLGVEELKSLEIILTGKEEAIQSNTTILQKESKSIFNKNEPGILTQMQLNARAEENYEKAQENLQNVIGDIDARVNDARSQSLLSGQHEWQKYSISQAKAAAALYEGGSMYSLIYLSELESLTNERTARLQAEFDVLLQL